MFLVTHLGFCQARAVSRIIPPPPSPGSYECIVDMTVPSQVDEVKHVQNFFFFPMRTAVRPYSAGTTLVLWK